MIANGSFFIFVKAQKSGLPCRRAQRKKLCPCDFYVPLTLPVCVQILRSASQWSAGISHVEDSIHQAYVEQINNAKYFIYIEVNYIILSRYICLAVLSGAF